MSQLNPSTLKLNSTSISLLALSRLWPTTQLSLLHQKSWPPSPSKLKKIKIHLKIQYSLLQLPLNILNKLKLCLSTKIKPPKSKSKLSQSTTNKLNKSLLSRLNRCHGLKKYPSLKDKSSLHQNFHQFKPLILPFLLPWPLFKLNTQSYKSKNQQQSSSNLWNKSILSPISMKVKPKRSKLWLSSTSRPKRLLLLRPISFLRTSNLSSLKNLSTKMEKVSLLPITWPKWLKEFPPLLSSRPTFKKNSSFQLNRSKQSSSPLEINTTTTL